MPQPDTKNIIRIKAVGDIALPSLVKDPNTARTKTPRTFDDVKPYLIDHDLLIGNLEGAITNTTLERPDIKARGGFSFRFVPGLAAKTLADNGFDGLNIANNHILDFQKQGLDDTVKELSAAGVAAVGQKAHISNFLINNTKVSLIGFYDHPDFNNFKSSTEIKTLLGKARSEAGVLIVTFHGGAEGEKALHIKNERERTGSLDRGNIVQFARACIDSGADCVIGSGPHVLRALELYKGKLIAYSLGNFVCSGGLSSKGVRGLSAILDLSLDNKGNLQRAAILPVHIDIANQSRPKYDETGRSIRLLQELTREFYNGEKKELNLKITSDGKIEVTSPSLLAKGQKPVPAPTLPPQVLKVPRP